MISDATHPVGSVNPDGVPVTFQAPVTDKATAIALLGGPQNTVYGPGYYQVNMSLFKTFSTWREQNLQFRADGFNVLNHPTLGTPNASMNCDRRSDFGTEVLPEQHTGCALLPACVEVFVLTIKKTELKRLLFTGGRSCLTVVCDPPVFFTHDGEIYVAVEVLLPFVFFHSSAVFGSTLVLAQSSPDESEFARSSNRSDFNVQPGTNKQAAEPDGQLVYTVTFHQKKIFEDSALRLELANQAPLAQPFTSPSATTGSGVDDYSLLAGKTSAVHDAYNSLTLQARESSSSGRVFEIEARVYNSGLAFRYRVPEQPATLAVSADTGGYRVSAGNGCRCLGTAPAELPEWL